MYLLVNKSTGKNHGFKETTQIAEYLNLNPSSIYRRFKDSNRYEDDAHIIFKADYIEIKSKRGNKKGKRNIY